MGTIFLPMAWQRVTKEVSVKSRFTWKIWLSKCIFLVILWCNRFAGHHDQAHIWNNLFYFIFLFQIIYTLNKIANATLSKLRYFRTLLLLNNDFVSTTLPGFSVVHFNVKIEKWTLYLSFRNDSSKIGFPVPWENGWTTFSFVIVSKLRLNFESEKTQVNLIPMERRTNWWTFKISDSDRRIQRDKFFSKIFRFLYL